MTEITGINAKYKSSEDYNIAVIVTFPAFNFYDFPQEEFSHTFKLCPM